MAKRGPLSIVGVLVGLVACGTDGQSSPLARGADSGTPGGGAAGAGGSAGGASSGGGGGVSASSGSSGGGGPNGGVTGSGGVLSGGATGSGGAPGGAGGSGGTGGASNTAVDLYVLFDETTSMICTTPTGSRSQNAMDGFLAFLQSPGASGVGIGIQYWMIGGFSPSCTASDYATPDVEIAPLPGVRATIAASLAAHAPGSMTGPGPVLQGGVDHAATWATAHPGRKVAVLLVADGTLAAACTNTDAVAVARAAFTRAPSVRTYVLGLVDGVSAPCALDPSPASAADFDPIALAGGTNAAYIANVGADGAKGVTDAFAAIAAAASR